MKQWAFFVVCVVLCVPPVVFAQAWSGIIDPPRAVDWSGVGATVTHRTTQCGATITAYTGTADTINTAIGNCPAGQFVLLGAGTFTLSTGITLDTSDVTLRGSGALNTRLNVSGITPVSCHIGAGRGMNMCNNNGTNIGVDSPEHTATWTAGYTQGTTTVTLSNATGLLVGSTVWLDQADDTTDGYPAAGDIFLCDVGTSNCGNNGTGESYARGGRGAVEGHVVVSCSPSCNSGSATDVTITPPVMFPAFRSGKSPGAWWGNSATIMKNTGLEDLTFDYTSVQDGIYVINCTNCWIKRVRILNTVDPGSQGHFHIFTVNAVNSTFADNYFHGPPTSALIAIYQVALHVSSNNLFQNNIHHTASSVMVPNSTAWGNVFAYNYVDNGVGASWIAHGLSGFNLMEGNDWKNASGDVIHGPHFFETFFRNYHNGNTHNPSNTETQAGIALYSNNRFYNVIGNVFGASNWSTYQSLEAHSTASIYELGWHGTGSGTAVSDDANVSRTIMRWGNWDNVTSTNDNGSNDSTGTRFVSGEVPSGITNYANSVPASQALPSSFYLASRPNSWWGTPWGTPAWPPIGPDVSGSTVTVNTGGHANKIPARLCFENTSQTSGILNFDPVTCYITVATGPAFLSEPTGLSLTGNATPVFLGEPTGASLTGNATPVFLGEPTGVNATGNATPVFLGEPTGLSLTGQ